MKGGAIPGHIECVEPIAKEGSQVIDPAARKPPMESVPDICSTSLYNAVASDRTMAYMEM